MKSVQVSLKKIKATKMKQIVDRDFCNIWWLLKEPFVFESKLILSFGFLLGLLGQKYSLDVGKNTSLCDGDTGEQFV